MNNCLLLSIHPQHAEKIISGEKTMELRKVRPARLASGDCVAVYVTKHVAAIRAIFTVGEVIESTPRKLWAIARKEACVTQLEYLSYYTHDTKPAYGIRVGRCVRIDEICLHTLLAKLPGFRPPQAYRYLTAAEQKKIFGGQSAAGHMVWQQFSEEMVPVLVRDAQKEK